MVSHLRIFAIILCAFYSTVEESIPCVEAIFAMSNGVATGNVVVGETERKITTRLLC